MRCNLAFAQMSDGRLLVLMEAVWGFSSSLHARVTSQAIEDENEFLQRVVFANLEQQETIDLIGRVLLALTGRYFAQAWTSLDLTEQQLQVLGLMPGELALGSASSSETNENPGVPDAESFREAVLQSPLPICMMVGPEHRVTFINEPYVRIAGRSSVAQFLDRPIREALFDLVGQPFFNLLDQVYRTGEPFVGKEMRATLLEDRLGGPREHFFDFVYYPVRDRQGEVCGILAQAEDVTERVLEKQVRDSRETQLYRQWAELDAIYRQAPVGICLIDANTLRVLRVNELKAASLGRSVEEVVGQRITDLVADFPRAVEVYRRVCHDRVPRQFEYSAEMPKGSGKRRSWLWSLNPVFGATGEVEAIASLVVEVKNSEEGGCVFEEMVDLTAH